MSKVGRGLEEIKVKSDVDVAIPTVAHSAFPFLLLVESDVEERASVLLDVEFPHDAKFKSILQNTAAMTAKPLKRIERTQSCTSHM